MKICQTILPSSDCHTCPEYITERLKAWKGFSGSKAVVISESHYSVQFSRSVMSNPMTPWTAACQASLSITNSRSLLKLMSIRLVMPSNHLILCHSLLFLPSIFPASGSFQMSQFLASGGPSIGVSASPSIHIFIPMNIQN